MRYYILIAFIFLGCASQMKPSGGPIDAEGPKVTEIYPQNKSIILDSKSKIILEFDELIDPISVINAVSIQNFSDFEYKVQGKKLIITPINKWPSYNTLKITINRNISDMLSNAISSPIQLFYFNQKLNNNKIIQGSITNINSDIFELGLYKIINNEYILTEKLQSDLYGNFKFSYLEEGKYIVAAIQNNIEDIERDIRIKKFGFITQDTIDLFKSDTSYVLIKTGPALEKLFIQSFQQINNQFGYFILNNGEEYPFIFPKKDEGSYLKGDSLLVDLTLNNQIESYSTPSFKIFINDLVDTLAPTIDKHYFEGNKYHIIFNEPIKEPIFYYEKDSIINEIEYNFINPFSIVFNPSFNLELKITGMEDLYGNQSNDTTSIFIESNIKDTIYNGGSVYGQIHYQGTNLVIVKAEDLNSDLTYYSTVTANQEFSFIDIKPGFYKFSAYEILGDYDANIYFSGYWPFKRAAKFGEYPEILEVRTLWDFKDMKIILE